MPENQTEFPLRSVFGAESVHARDLFPEIVSSEEIDRRIMHSEQRIKFWIMAGVASNLVVAIGAAIPAIFYIGQISVSVQQSADTMKKIEASQDANLNWVQNRMIWETRVEEALRRDGVPVEHRDTDGDK